MKIIIGKTAGFCYGVKRAVDGANEAVKESDKKTYCLGEIVHNNEVIKDLLAQKALDKIEKSYQELGFPKFRIHPFVDQSAAGKSQSLLRSPSELMGAGKGSGMWWLQSVWLLPL